MSKLSPAISESLSRAFSAYNAGKLIEAENLCQQIIAAKPEFFDALIVLAMVQSRLGKKELALTSYDRALAARPDDAEALFNRGNSLHELKRFEEAVESYERALAVRPDYAEALFNRGNALQVLKRFEEAVESYERALAVRPDFAESHCNRGLALHELKRFEEALASYHRAIGLRSDFAEALFNRGNTLRELRRYEEAVGSYERALAVRPEYAEALFNRGNTLRELKRYEEAVASYGHSLAVRPEYAEALSNRGIALHELKRYEEAVDSYERAVAVRPDFPEALFNRGNSLQELKRFEEALASYDCAIAVRPDWAGAHFNEALCRLLIGDFQRGWREHEWRWKTDFLRRSERSFTQPLWLEQENISGRTILLHGEQGFGDTIQFCRYAPLVSARGARVILEVQEPLQDLMTTLVGPAQVLSRGSPLPDFDLQCPLLSLPLAFGTCLDTIPSVTPYLSASVEAAKNWQARLGTKARPRIGLAWSGQLTHPNDKNRSIGLRSLLPLLDAEAEFVSLQKEVRADDVTILKDRGDLLHFGDALTNFSDTAALISNMDLVISVDTSVAHVAGALAKPVWVLLPFIPDWRWLLERDDSPWYPTARLFRQDETRTWDNVIARVHAALDDFVR